MAEPIRRRAGLRQAAVRGEEARAAAPAPRPRGGVSTHQATGSSNSTLSNRRVVVDETTQEITGDVKEFPPGVTPAQVRFGAGLTINMGDFNMLRLDVSITIPCMPDEVDEAFEEASQFVADKVAEEEIRWTGASHKRGGR